MPQVPLQAKTSGVGWGGQPCGQLAISAEDTENVLSWAERTQLGADEALGPAHLTCFETSSIPIPPLPAPLVKSLLNQRVTHGLLGAQHKYSVTKPDILVVSFRSPGTEAWASLPRSVVCCPREPQGHAGPPLRGWKDQGVPEIFRDRGREGRAWYSLRPYLFWATLRAWGHLAVSGRVPSG